MSIQGKSPATSNSLERVRRTLALLAIYSVALTACRYLSYELRFDFLVPKEWQGERLWSIAVSLPVKLGFLLLFRQFGSLLTYFSVPDLMRIVMAIGCANLGLLLFRWGILTESVTPRGVVLMDFVLSVLALASVRLGFRIYRERTIQLGADSGLKPRRIAVLGAGDAGAQFVREAQTRPGLRLRPTFFLDDDRAKHGQEIHGVRILGAPEDIGKLRREYEVDACVLAMPSAPGKRLREIYKLLSAEGLKVEIIPSAAELASGRVQVTRIRQVQVDDLLGRQSVDLRSPEVMALLDNKVVLVTGAGGSIGSELCRQIARLNPQRLLMLDQSEGSLFLIEQELNEVGIGSVALPLVGDILDRARMEYVFGRYQPAVVFHAAAHKHVYLMERQPAEALRNNVLGTRLLAQLAARHQVKKFVLISTDKAVNPTSVMGATKRLAELQLPAVQAEHGPGTQFMAVRFGNVLGSSGSVIPIFKRQIERGGPVTVTHPDVMRYFMTIPEAVGLVLQSSVQGKGGEIFVLDMGEPVKIVDLARQMIELSGMRVGDDIEIVFTGLKPGEKLFEELQHRTEQYLATEHPKIMRFVSPGTDAGSPACRPEEFEAGLYRMQPNEIKGLLQRCVPEYTPFQD